MVGYVDIKVGEVAADGDHGSSMIIVGGSGGGVNDEGVQELSGGGAGEDGVALEGEGQEGGDEAWGKIDSPSSVSLREGAGTGSTEKVCVEVVLEDDAGAGGTRRRRRRKLSAHNTQRKRREEVMLPVRQIRRRRVEARSPRRHGGDKVMSDPCTFTPYG